MTYEARICSTGASTRVRGYVKFLKFRIETAKIRSQNIYTKIYMHVKYLK